MAHRDGSPNVLLLMPRQKQVLCKRSKSERRAERKLLGALRSQVVSPKTESRYLEHVSRFLQFLKDHGKSYPRHFTSLDLELSTFIEHLWEEGDPKSWASDVLSGLGHFIPAVKPHLIGSWRLHSAWSRAELPARAPPLSPVITYALAQLAFDSGWMDTAVLLILGFHTFARSGELFAAKCGDFNLIRGKGTWSLPLTKSGQRVGASESLAIDDPFVGTAVVNLCRGRAPGDLLSTVPPGAQRKRLHELLTLLNLVTPFRWYSLRRGGATHEFRKSNNLPAVCFKGRWNSVKTARIYICDGIAQLTELALSPSKTRQLRALASRARPDWLNI